LLAEADVPPRRFPRKLLAENLRVLGEGDSGFVAKFVRRFVEDTASQLVALEAAVAQEDGDEARRIAANIVGLPGLLLGSGR
jgi:HPt (histidine-containing phosphotransfer) domain-containing protein